MALVMMWSHRSPSRSQFQWSLRRSVNGSPVTSRRAAIRSSMPSAPRLCPRVRHRRNRSRSEGRPRACRGRASSESRPGSALAGRARPCGVGASHRRSWLMSTRTRSGRTRRRRRLSARRLRWDGARGTPAARRRTGDVGCRLRVAGGPGADRPEERQLGRRRAGDSQRARSSSRDRSVASTAVRASCVARGATASTSSTVVAAASA